MDLKWVSVASSLMDFYFEWLVQLDWIRFTEEYGKITWNDTKADLEEECSGIVFETDHVFS